MINLQKPSMHDTEYVPGRKCVSAKNSFRNMVAEKFKIFKASAVKWKAGFGRFKKDKVVSESLRDYMLKR